MKKTLVNQVLESKSNVCGVNYCNVTEFRNGVGVAACKLFAEFKLEEFFYKKNFNKETLEELVPLIEEYAKQIVAEEKLD